MGRAMPVLTLEDFAAALPPAGALAGLDLGEKTIGVAVSDSLRMVGSPLETLRRTKFTADLERLFAILDERRIGALVVGLPLNMDGTEGPRCQSNRAFARNLLTRRDLPLLFWDERLSTAAVTRMMIDEHDLTRKRQAQAVDKLAAAWILQGALERLRAFG
jgi:putative holliday junction resolvase